MTCVVCDHRPARVAGLCTNCNAKVESERKRKADQEPFRFVTYHGHVVGMFPNGRDGNYIPRLLKREPDKLPKGRTINLDHYCEGFTRDQIKKMKRCILALAS